MTAVHAKTIPDPVDTTNLVIARVTTTAFAGEDVQDLGGTWGDVITIDLTNADLAVGDTVFVLAQVEDYNGGQLEVQEIARVDETQFPAIASDVPRIEQLFTQDPLYARIASSREIVVGSVGPISPEDGVCSSEHCADWQLAMLSSNDLLCGAGSTPLTTGFSGSLDIAWYMAPKLMTNEHAVLLLHHAPMPIDPEMATPNLVVTDPLDVHTLADQAEIAAILASPPPLP